MTMEPFKLKPFSGRTDVALLKGPSGRDFFHRVTTLLEFKSPWGALHHTRAQQPRDQTLVQTELFSQNLKLRGSSRTSFVAVLTDLFATSLHLKLLQPDETAKAIFISTERVVDPSEFILLLLFTLEISMMETSLDIRYLEKFGSFPIEKVASASDDVEQLTNNNMMNAKSSVKQEAPAYQNSLQFCSPSKFLSTKSI
jgi:hypothetical protein